MRNIISTVITSLLALCEKAASGVQQFGAAIGIVQNTEQKIRDDAAALLLARDNYEQAKATLSQRRQVVRSVPASGRQFLMLVRDILKHTYGTEYSQAWDIVGFVGSLAIPANPDRVETLLQSVQAFFIANPAKENADLQMTAARAEALFTAIVEAQNAVATQDSVVENLRKIRDDKAALVRKRIRGLITELTQLIDPVDPRWLAFGLNMPGAEQTPDVPVNVTAVLAGNTASVRWAGAPRADHYRVWKKVNGVDQDFVAVGSPADLDFVIEGLPANSTIQIAISAVNSGGESAKSQPVTIVTQ